MKKHFINKEWTYILQEEPFRYTVTSETIEGIILSLLINHMIPEDIIDLIR